MNDYLKEMRRLVGTRPLIVCGAAALMIDAQQRALFHHRADNDCWGLPGGCMELGESLEETAWREVQEELGLVCHSLQLFGVYSGPEFYHHAPSGDEVHPVIVIYVCREYSGTISVEPTEGKRRPSFR